MNKKKLFWISLIMIFVLSTAKLFFKENLLVNSLLALTFFTNLITILSLSINSKIFKATRLLVLISFLSLLAFSAFAYFSGEELVLNNSLKTMAISLSFIHFILVIYTVIKFKVVESEKI